MLCTPHKCCFAHNTATTTYTLLCLQQWHYFSFGTDLLCFRSGNFWVVLPMKWALSRVCNMPVVQVSQQMRRWLGACRPSTTVRWHPTCWNSRTMQLCDAWQAVPSTLPHKAPPALPTPASQLPAQLPNQGVLPRALSLCDTHL